jgi:CRP-like cAMP-binding protein
MTAPANTAPSERSRPGGLAGIALSPGKNSPALTVDVQRALLAGNPHDIVSVANGEDIFVEGAEVTEACLLLEGWACRYKTLMDGRRQIIGFVLPGELCSSWAAELGSMEHGVRALCPARVAKVDRAVVLARMDQHSALVDRLRLTAAQEHTILGAWLLNIGQRKAPERIAHLFCELATRMRNIGMPQVDGGYEAPLTQTDLADALGLTSVHVNRVLQKLRERGFIDFRRGVLSIRDVPALCAYVEFKDGYLSH